MIHDSGGHQIGGQTAEFHVLAVLSRQFEEFSIGFVGLILCTGAGIVRLYVLGVFLIAEIDLRPHLGADVEIDLVWSSRIHVCIAELTNRRKRAP